MNDGPDLAPSAVIRRLYDAFAARDRENICAILADNCRWIIPGRGSQSGVYEGHDAVIELFRGIMRDTAGTATVEITDLIADDRYAVVLQRGTGTIDGRPGDLDECLVYKVEDGRVVEMKEFQFDLYGFEEWLHNEPVTQGGAQ